jgi:hypothetical protein
VPVAESASDSAPSSASDFASSRGILSAEPSMNSTDREAERLARATAAISMTNTEMSRMTIPTIMLKATKIMRIRIPADAADLFL